MKNTLIKKLLNDKAMISKVKILFSWRKASNELILDIPHLYLTVVKYRQFLQKEIKNQLKTKKYSINLNLILNKIDSILPASIGDYRSQNWEDSNLVANTILQRSVANDSIKLAGLQYFTKFKSKSINLIIHNNEKILSNEKLTQLELNDLNKRIIFGFFGGIENIEKIELVKYKFNSDYTSYEYSGDNSIEHRFLKINVKNQDQVLRNKYLKDDWDMQLGYYYEHLKNGLLTYQLDSIYGAANEEQYELIEEQLFISESLKNNHLVAINYCETNKDLIKQTINSWKLDLVEYQNKSEIIEQFFNENVEIFIKQFETKIIKLIELYFWSIEWEKNLYEEINHICQTIDINYEFTYQMLEEIVNIIYEHYEQSQQKANHPQSNLKDLNFNIDSNSDNESSNDLTNEPSTSSGIYNIKNK